MVSINGEGELVPNEASNKEAHLSALLLANNQMLTVVMNAAIELNLFEIIGNNDAFMSASEIASKMAIEHYSELPNRLERMLRLLASHSLLTCATRTTADGNIERVYKVSSVGKYFVTDESGGTLASFTSLLCSRAMSQVWPTFKDGIIDATADDLFKKVYGMPAFQYADKDPTFNQLFNKAMDEISTLDMKAIFQVYKGFEGISTLVNVGGGTGKTLDMIISEYPSIKGINFDLPHVVEKAPTYPGIKHVGGDMYVSVPQGDAIFLKAVLHNWSDEDCLRLLRNCHKALPQNGKVIIVDFIVPETPNSDASKIVSLVDNIMFVIGGRERTSNEFEALSKLSGFSGFEVAVCALGALGVMEFHK
ncbi:isoliquiritigenin 2'-O-methyltransferase [Cajanus cajan]|uniref:Isoliquiritigenin 2'-O-methyltransferase n=1 Tax=Cajanus cajan TaxID=3821 RepID=A0A151QS26_CAJCA|nr:isoliquiritigenin 2'-O-methyltransferase [Cajanus cajan]KYP33109.1 Isoliquiritigenin 2'-O-methyltransferase [Cajanus cajan]